VAQAVGLCDAVEQGVKVPLRLAAPDAVGDADWLGLPVPQEVNVGEGCCVRETLADALTLMVRPQLRETLGDALEVAQRVSEPLPEGVTVSVGLRVSLDAEGLRDGLVLAEGHAESVAVGHPEGVLEGLGEGDTLALTLGERDALPLPLITALSEADKEGLDEGEGVRDAVEEVDAESVRGGEGELEVVCVEHAVPEPLTVEQPLPE